MSKLIADFIPEYKQLQFCTNCYDAICSYQCPIWRDAKAERDKEEKMKKYTIRDREAGNVIETNLTYEEATNMLARFEEEDLLDGIYEKDFYEIIEED